METEQPRNRDGNFTLDDRSQSHAPRGAHRDGWVMHSGQVVMGPSFYVWDESPKQAREWGVELANAWLAQRR
jgi:hypothetical protein